MSLIDKLPYFYNNGITRPIIEAEQIERDKLFEKIQDTLNQLFIDTATWGLDYWEDMLLIPHNYTKSYEERRSIIYTRLRGAKTTTVEVVKQIAYSFFNVENVEVYEDNANYIFYINLENCSFETTNLSDVMNTLDIYKPAHLNYGFIITNKGKVVVNSTQRIAYSYLPICNVTYVGTWWKSYAEGSSNNSSLIKGHSYNGYSNLPICGVFISNGE